MDTVIHFDKTSVPTWYELSASEPGAFVIRIHKQAMDYLKSIPWNDGSRIVGWYKQKMGFVSFSPPGEESVGFEGVLKSIPSTEPDWLLIKCPLPIVRANDTKSSSIETPAKLIWAFRASLELIFKVLWLFQGSTYCTTQQLIIIEGIGVSTEMGGAGLSATLTPSVIRFLTTLQNEDDAALLPIAQSMDRADKHMFQDDRYIHFDNHALKRACRFRKPKWISLHVPGDACDLSRAYYSSEVSPDGYLLDPHNVDSHIQQLDFLVGLAALHDLVRKAGF